MRPLPVQSLPDLPSFILGASIIRGVPTPIVDAGALFDCQEPGSPTRVVTVRAGGRVVGLAVEQVAEIRAIPTSTSRELPSLLRSARSDAVQALLALDQELVVVMDAARMVPNSAWDLIGRPAS